MELPKGTTLENMNFGRLVQETVMGSQGKFGAYGSPSDVKIARDNANLYKCKFTVLTPAMRESDRTAFIAARQVSVYLVGARQAPLANLLCTHLPGRHRSFSFDNNNDVSQVQEARRATKRRL